MYLISTQQATTTTTTKKEIKFYLLNEIFNHKLITSPIDTHKCDELIKVNHPENVYEEISEWNNMIKVV